MRVLFAVNNEKISETITKKDQSMYRTTPSSLICGCPAF